MGHRDPAGGNAEAGGEALQELPLRHGAVVRHVEGAGDVAAVQGGERGRGDVARVHDAERVGAGADHRGQAAPDEPVECL